MLLQFFPLQLQTKSITRNFDSFLENLRQDVILSPMTLLSVRENICHLLHKESVLVLKTRLSVRLQSFDMETVTEQV